MLAEQTVEVTETNTEVVDITAEVAEIHRHMTTEYTSIWRVSDFLLDVAAKVSDEKRAEVHLMHADVSPNAQRSVVKTSDVKAIVNAVVDMVG